jgi:hypothetical protein
MDISFWSIIIFIIITIVYYIFPSIGKPKLTLDILNQTNGLSTYYSSVMPRLGLYILAIIVSQFFLNSSYLMAKCGGSIGQNMGAAALFTFIPWVLIFGILLVVIMMFPGFKTAFSDVIGYFVISSSANDILSSILIDTNVDKAIQATTDPAKQNELKSVAEAITKICGNKSILINQMNPENFNKVWNLLKPLMIENAFDDLVKKQSLLDLVVLKDNIGEAMWYTYTAILISSIVYYNLATRGCIKDINQIKQEHDEYIKQQEESQQQQELNNQTTYTN